MKHFQAILLIINKLKILLHKSCNKIINKGVNHYLKYPISLLDHNKSLNQILLSISIIFLGKKIIIKIFMRKFVNLLYKNVWRRDLMGQFLHMARQHLVKHIPWLVLPLIKEFLFNLWEIFLIIFKSNRTKEMLQFGLAILKYIMNKSMICWIKIISISGWEKIPRRDIMQVVWKLLNWINLRISKDC